MKNAEDQDAAVGSSPVCWMNEADDAYMGYADRGEIAAFLNLLLEAGRARAQVARDSARTMADGALGWLMQAIERDEVHWCGMLARRLETIGAPVSSAVGADYDEAMAIADIGERVRFLDSGRSRILHKLREMLPRLRDDRLHADLAEMLRAHEAAIALAVEIGRQAPCA